MQASWKTGQIPIMRAMAGVVAQGHGDVLEIGFGRGVASTFIQEIGVRSHTIVECNDSVVKRFASWREAYTEQDIRFLHGRWQDVTDQMGSYDGVFFTPTRSMRRNSWSRSPIARPRPRAASRRPTSPRPISTKMNWIGF